LGNRYSPCLFFPAADRRIKLHIEGLSVAHTFPNEANQCRLLGYALAIDTGLPRATAGAGAAVPAAGHAPGNIAELTSSELVFACVADLDTLANAR